MSTSEIRRVRLETLGMQDALPTGDQTVAPKVFVGTITGSPGATVPAYFKVQRQSASGAITEGGSPTLTTKSDTTLVYVLGPNVPTLGQQIICWSTGGGWVGELCCGGTPSPCFVNCTPIAPSTCAGCAMPEQVTLTDRFGSVSLQHNDPTCPSIAGWSACVTINVADVVTSCDENNRAITHGAGRTAVLYNLTCSHGYKMSGPSQAVIGTLQTFTVDPQGSYPGTVTVTPTPGFGVAPLFLVFLTPAAQTFTITPTALGNLSLSLSNTGGQVDPAPLVCTVVNALPGPAPTATTIASPDIEFFTLRRQWISYLFNPPAGPWVYYPSICPCQAPANICGDFLLGEATGLRGGVSAYSVKPFLPAQCNPFFWSDSLNGTSGNFPPLTGDPIGGPVTLSAPLLPPSFTCHVPRNSLQLSWAGGTPGSPKTMYHDGGTAWIANATTVDNLAATLSCGTNGLEFTVSRMGTGGVTQSCQSPGIMGQTLTLLDHICEPLHLHYRVTDCPAFASQGFTDFFVDLLTPQPSQSNVCCSTFSAKGCNGFNLPGVLVSVYTSSGGTLLASGITGPSGFVALTWSGSCSIFVTYTKVRFNPESRSYNVTAPNGTPPVQMTVATGYHCLPNLCADPIANTLHYTDSVLGGTTLTWTASPPFPGSLTGGGWFGSFIANNVACGCVGVAGAGPCTVAVLFTGVIQTQYTPNVIGGVCPGGVAVGAFPAVNPPTARITCPPAFSATSSARNADCTGPIAPGLYGAPVNITWTITE